MELFDLPLMKFLPAVSPDRAEPKHLRQVTDLFERIDDGERVKAVIDTPPRHWKTETILHGCVWLMGRARKRKRDMRVAYGTYAEDLAFEKSRLARGIAEAAELPFTKRGVSDWRITAPGDVGFTPRGVGGGLTGRGFNCGVVDDPVKDRLQAESSVYRERTASWFRSVFYTRRQHGNVPILVNMARWHSDDLAGRILDGQFGKGWEHIHMPAISDEGEPLAPDVWGLDALLDIKETLGPYDWEALYQGSPRPRGGTVFGDPYGYETLPDRHSDAIGIDLNYVAKTTSDYSVIVVMLHFEGYYYVVDVYRVQTRPPEFKEVLRSYRAKYPRAKIRWYASATEEGAASFFRNADYNSQGQEKPGLPVEVLPPHGDKFTRAIPYAADWNAGRVLVPVDSDGKHWINPFISEHANFTGSGDERDDQVDAAVAARDQLAAGGTATYANIPKRGERPPGVGGRRRM